jgi:hypothetical protein
MYKIDWNKFKVINKDCSKSFEELAYHLFCRKFSLSEGIRADHNHPGLETYPIYVKKEQKWVGFQAKFFENKLSDKSSVKQIVHSIQEAKNAYKELDKIILYTHQAFGSENPKYKRQIEKAANPIKIDWFTDSKFKISLSHSENLDLAQLYFDFSDELGFIKSCVNPKILTLLQSSEYIDLTVNYNDKKINNLVGEILNVQEKIFLISGHPGSGKSILMHRLFQKVSGLDLDNVDGLKATRNFLLENKAIPMLINLKDCAFDSIENLIRNRQSDYNVWGKKVDIIYLLDGLDEMSDKKVDNTLAYLAQLGNNKNTKKIIISCRSGNPNKSKVKLYFETAKEYKIQDLTNKEIKKYFKSKYNVEQKKQKQLCELNKKNKTLLLKIKDILLVTLLWDTIEGLNESSTILDLLDKKINLLINDPQYKKNIEVLNLPNPKVTEIIELNKEISFHFQKQSQSRLPCKDIQQIILNKYPRIDYKSANEILNYIAAAFFDDNSSLSSNESSEQTFIYQHKMYQDFFFIKKIVAEYDNDIKILREYKVLSNHDLLDLFLRCLKEKHKREENLPGMIELNRIEGYLSHRNDFSTYELCYYRNSPRFIYSLAMQDKKVLDDLLDDENLAIGKKIIIDLNGVKNELEKVKEGKDNYRLNDCLKNFRYDGIQFMLKSIATFWSFDKKDVANKLRDSIKKFTQLFKKYKFPEHLKNDWTLKDPIYESGEDYLYSCIVIDKKKPGKIFDHLIRSRDKDFMKSKSTWELNENKKEKEKLVKLFFRVCINNKQESLPNIINKLDDAELLMLLDILVSEKNLQLLMQDNIISKKIKVKIPTIKEKSTSINLLFCKRIFDIKLTAADKEFLEKFQKQINNEFQYLLPLFFREGENIDKLLDYAIVYYLCKQQHQVEYQNAFNLYAALFSDFVELLKGRKTIKAMVIDYINNNLEINTSSHQRLDDYMSFLWAHIFVNSKEELEELLSIKDILIIKKNNIITLEFYLKLQELDQDLFVKIINRSELQIFENELKEWGGDFPEYINRCFNLASLYAHIDKQKAAIYIAKGITDGIVRHGWRKDPIVSYFLVEALEILWKNNWVSREELIEYTKKVFELTFRVSKITDGKETWKGPYNVIDLASKYNIDLAVDLKNNLQKKKEGEKVLNLAVTSILLGKVRLGLSIEKIKNGMEEYEIVYSGSEYLEQQFKVYVAIAQNDFYTPKEMEDAFENAYVLANGLENSYLNDKIKQDFVKLCKKYRRIVKPFDEQKELLQKGKSSVVDFIEGLEKVKTKSGISDLYKKLNNYNDHIVLTDFEQWELLIEKTYSVNKNIKLFTELLRNNSFPSIDFLTTHSKYLHFGVGAALKNINTKKEIMNHLFNCPKGMCGFIKIMKSYECIDEREMCLKLFKQYLRFCDFLVN